MVDWCFVPEHIHTVDDISFHVWLFGDLCGCDESLPRNDWAKQRSNSEFDISTLQEYVFYFHFLIKPGMCIQELINYTEPERHSNTRRSVQVCVERHLVPHLLHSVCILWSFSGEDNTDKLIFIRIIAFTFVATVSSQLSDAHTHIHTTAKHEWRKWKRKWEKWMWTNGWKWNRTRNRVSNWGEPG